jgi:sugar transferase (PEP-CTERM/EpsH1 system associated)
MRVREIEKSLPRKAQGVALTTQPEAELYRTIAPSMDTRVITNGVDLEFFSAVDGNASKNTCVFVGAMDYRANVEGVVWFAREVWPTIKARVADARFQIVGRNPTREVLSLGNVPGIDVIGEVVDVRPYVRAGAVSIAPLFVARGIQNKVLEAMAMGRPVIASPAAATGIHAQPGSELFCADSAADWQQTLLSLWADENRQRFLGTNARRFVERHHSWDACLAPWEAWLNADWPTETARLVPT